LAAAAAAATTLALALALLLLLLLLVGAAPAGVRAANRQHAGALTRVLALPLPPRLVALVAPRLAAAVVLLVLLLVPGAVRPRHATAAVTVRVAAAAVAVAVVAGMAAGQRVV
jgi:hypothetical protein